MSQNYTISNFLELDLTSNKYGVFVRLVRYNPFWKNCELMYVDGKFDSMFNLINKEDVDTIKNLHEGDSIKLKGDIQRGQNNYYTTFLSYVKEDSGKYKLNRIYKHLIFYRIWKMGGGREIKRINSPEPIYQ